MLRPLLPVLCVIAVIGTTVAGLEWIKRQVIPSPACGPLRSLELVDAPQWVHDEEWAPRIRSVVKTQDLAALPEAQMVQQVAAQLSASGWVKQVHSVAHRMDGTVEISCEYRRPIAMLQTSRGYMPVDRDGYRLPEVYEQVDNNSGWLRLVGVRTEPPPLNQAFNGDDAVAAIRLASYIFDAGWDIASRISAVDVNNFRGRVDRHKDHILLWRPGCATPIIWGSAIGEEMEEPTAAAKLATIVALLRGGEPQAQANVSILPGIAIVPVEQTIQTADGSARRGR